MGRLVWEALPVKAPLESWGPLGAPVPDASLNTDTTLLVVDVSGELGRGLLRGGPGPQKASSKNTQQVSGKLEPQHSRECPVKGLAPYKAFRGKQLVKSGLARVKFQKTGTKNSQIAKAGPFHKGQL